MVIPIPVPAATLATGDVNGDGRPDVVAARSTSVTVLHTSVDGVPVIAHAAVDLGASGAGRILLDDVTGDNAPEFIVQVDDGVVVLENDGAGFVTAPIDRLFAPIGTTDIALARFDADVLVDLVIVNERIDALIVGRGAGDGTFGAPDARVAVTRPTVGALHDLNGDDVPDLCVSDLSEPTARLYVGDGLGAFARASMIEGIGGTNVQVEIADLDHDAIPDLVLRKWQASIVDVRFGLGDGTFGSAHALPIGGVASHLRVGDVTGDGNVDLVIALAASSALNVVRGFGDGTFAAPVPTAIVAPATWIELTAGDDDPALEILASIPGASRIGRFDANATGELAAGHTTRLDDVVLFSMRDLDGDGRDDLVARRDVPTGGFSARLTVLRGDVGLTFTPLSETFVHARADALLWSDLNGDGADDLVLADDGQRLVSIHPGTGDGTFGAVIYPRLHSHPSFVLTGPLDGDDAPDLVIGATWNDRVDVQLNRARRCGSDLSGDGATDAADLLQLLSAWGPCVGCAADFDDSGIVDFTDLLYLLDAWGPC